MGDEYQYVIYNAQVDCSFTKKLSRSAHARIFNPNLKFKFKVASTGETQSYIVNVELGRSLSGIKIPLTNGSTVSPGPSCSNPD